MRSECEQMEQAHPYGENRIQVAFSLDHPTMLDVDHRRGMIPRSRFIDLLISMAMNSDRELVIRTIDRKNVAAYRTTVHASLKPGLLWEMDKRRVPHSRALYIDALVKLGLELHLEETTRKCMERML